jgi:hypothetical protein
MAEVCPHKPIREGPRPLPKVFFLQFCQLGGLVIGMKQFGLRSYKTVKSFWNPA